MVFIIDYSVYKNVRNASWQCLIDCHITALPLKLSDICKHFEIKIIKKSDLGNNNSFAPKENEHGTIVFSDKQPIIIVDNSDLLTVQRYTIAHEIGHIFLGKQSTEYEAERFAIGILAPSCVLWGCNLHTAKDIADMCNISMKAAHNRAERMAVLYERNKFLTAPLERQVFEQFSEFISANKKDY